MFRFTEDGSYSPVWLQNLSMNLFKDNIFLLLSVPTIEKGAEVLNTDDLWVTEYRKRASRVEQYASSSLMPLEQDIWMEGTWLHVFLLCSDLWILSVVYSGHVQWSEFVLEVPGEREPFKIWKLKLWRRPSIGFNEIRNMLLKWVTIVLWPCEQSRSGEEWSGLQIPINSSGGQDKEPCVNQHRLFSEAHVCVCVCERTCSHPDACIAFLSKCPSFPLALTALAACLQSTYF